ncbi:MAG: chemotaxis protein CheX [Magnetococcales bacterium]|nr:chemotaxis protein CheX [Magnetococcales bacterium]MBF0151770.1 chemotaxis protein CheX [Magnetococcales bacterium]MBF0175047.1 chemotaxis protein CheX [Magnetococcales bacterium]MBF0632399.1 chemotaxis protein CheX [Magnetococcales bacterium]
MESLQLQLAGLIVESVQEIFSAYLFIDAVPGPVKISALGEVYIPPKTEVLAMVSYHGAFDGGMHLASPEYVACKLSGVFAGVELETLNAEACDAFGELANLIAGGVQTRLMEHHGLGEITLTPPTVSVNGQVNGIYREDLLSVQQYFKFAGGLMFAECFFIPPINESTPSN